MTLGQRIRSAREAYGMSQTLLAQRIGLSKTALSKIEHDHTKDPAYSTMKDIARVLRLRLDELDPQEEQEAPHGR